MRTSVLLGLRIAFAAWLASMPVLSFAASSGVVAAIEKKYAVTETTGDGEQITKDGTTMVMKCAGVYSVPNSALLKLDNPVTDGKIKKPNMLLSAALSKSGAHVLQTGEKVYVTKIDSKSDSNGDSLKFSLLTVDKLDVTGSDSKKKFDATVTFKFKKGYLDETPPEEVEQAIEAVMAPDTGDDAKADDKTPAQDQAKSQPPARAAAPAPVAQAAPPPAPAPPAAPKTVTIGESSTEVLQAMGMPLQMIDLGKKKTYVYKDMKIIFINDKVSDMQ